jgi:hypothetical protein
VADAVLLAAAQLCSASGMGWLALAKKEHWRQVRGSTPLARGTRRALSVLGSAAFIVALVLCALADHAAMAALVWMMELSASALLVAFTLSWRPRWLLWLVPWVRGEAGDYPSARALLSSRKD